MFDLSDSCAVITGAATGLGQAIAVGLANAGARVAVSGKPGTSLDETWELLGRDKRHQMLTLDVRDISQVRQGLAQAEQSFGRIDVLVNNAGINRPAAGLDVTPEEWDDHFSTNVRGGFFCAQAVAPGMIQRGYGRVIFISSQSGLVGIPGQPTYCATKGAVVNLVRTLGVEWAAHGITVNSVAPTFVETDLTRKRLQDPVFLNFVLKKIPRGELATPEDIASAVVYLASREAGMVNCTTLPVDGGWTAW